MAGEVVAGQGGTVALGAAQTRIKNWKMSVQVDSKDVTHMGSAGWKYTKGVLKSANGSFETQAWPGDYVGSVVAGTFVDSSETGSKTYSGSFMVKEISPDVPYDDIVKWTVTFESYGSIALV